MQSHHTRSHHTILFAHTQKGRCEARYGTFHAILENNNGPSRRPFAALLKRDGVKIAAANFASSAYAQAWLRDQIRLAIEAATTFELADWASEPNLEARFRRRAAVRARRQGVTIIRYEQMETVLEKRAAIVRTYHCLRPIAQQGGA